MGWFGFNPASMLAVTDLRISFVVVHTILAGVVASLASMLTLMLKGLKPDPTRSVVAMPRLVRIG